MSTIVSDEELDKRTPEEIIEYKARNLDLYREFWIVVRKLAAGLREAPGTPGAALELNELLSVDVWKAKAEIEAELAAAWGKFSRCTTR